MAEEGLARRRLAARNAAANAVVGSATDEEAIRGVLSALGDGLDLTAAYYWRPASNSRGLSVAESWESPEAPPQPDVLPHGEGLPGQVWRTGEPAWTDGAAATAESAGTDPSERGSAPRTGGASSIVLPLTVHGTLAGVLELLCSRPVEEDVELLGIGASVARQLGHAMERRHAQRELRESGERLRFQASLLNAVGEAVTALDPEGQILYWNASAERLYGWRAEEVIGVSAEEVTPELVAQHTPDVLARLREGEAWTGELIMRDREGHAFPAMVTGSPVRGEDGDLRAVICTSRDITDRKRFEEAQQFLADAGRVLASSLDYLATLEEVCTQSVPLLGDCCIIHLTPESGDGGVLPVAHCSPELTDEETARLESAIAGPDGVLQDVLGSRHPRRIDREELEGTASGRILRDLGIAELLAAPLHARDQALGAFTFTRRADGPPYRDLDVRLADELALRVASAVDNGRLYRDSEESSRAKTDFLAVVSHELRTPLNAITGYADLMTSGVSGELSEEQVRQVERIKVGARHLAHLIDEILAFARLDAGREELRMEEVDAAEVAREAVVVIRPDAEAKGLSLDVDVPSHGPRIRTDASKVRQVLVNFLSNAVKYTEEGSVSVRVRPVTGGVEMSVSDTGIGIPEREHDRIFEPFRQVQSPNTRTVGGTGLGLSVNRRLVEILGGNISVESAPGRGSTFTVRLPAAPEEAS
ncbi:MAG TPA: ATP-binding protein [Longimicrobiales bacterium]|nr:ATP-binding protein [Longimicrobiales bacterium]